MTTKAETCRIANAKTVLLRSDASFKADFNGIELEGGTSAIVIRHFNNWVLVSNNKGEGWLPEMFTETTPEATTQKANEAASVKAREALSGLEEEMSQLRLALAQKEAAAIETAGRCCELEAQSSELKAKVAGLEAMLADQTQELEASENILSLLPPLASSISPQETKIFVGGLPPSCDEAMLKNHFGDCGAITDAVVIKMGPQNGHITFAGDHTLGRALMARSQITMLDTDSGREMPLEVKPDTDEKGDASLGEYGTTHDEGTPVMSGESRRESHELCQLPAGTIVRVLEVGKSLACARIEEPAGWIQFVHVKKVPACRKFHVSGLPPNCDDAMLRSRFLEYGEITVHGATVKKERRRGYITFAGTHTLGMTTTNATMSQMQIEVKTCAPQAAAFDVDFGSKDANDRERRKVATGLASKGFSVGWLLSFWRKFGERPHHRDVYARVLSPATGQWQGRISRTSTTNDVVRSLVIPDTSEKQCCYMDFEPNTSVKPKKLVSHWWGANFLGDILCVLSDATGLKGIALESYVDYGFLPPGVQLADDVLQKSYWMCIFAVNQHVSICGTCHDCNVVSTGKSCDICQMELFNPCPCGRLKYTTDHVLCQMDKFDIVMGFMEGGLAVALDTELKTLTRVWVLSEIGKALKKEEETREEVISWLMPNAIHDRFCGEREVQIDSVRDCSTSLIEDKERILRQIDGTVGIQAFDERVRNKVLPILRRYALVKLASEPQSGHAVQLLLKRKADPNSETTMGRTVLFEAAAGDNIGAVRELIDAQANINKYGASGCTPLYIAARQGHTAVVEALTDAKADVAKAEIQGTTPLSVSAQLGHVVVVQQLLSAKADVDTPNVAGASPLFQLASIGHLEVLQCLLGAEAEIYKPTNFGNTAMSVAKACGNQTIVEALRTAGETRLQSLQSLKAKQRDLQFLKGAGGRDSLINHDGDQLKIDTLASNGPDAVVGLYFATRPSSHNFTLLISTCYSEMQRLGKRFEVVFLSSDHSAESFDEHFAEMPGFAIPFSERSLQRDLVLLMGIERFPQLILMKPDGTILTTDGICAIQCGVDLFPWRMEDHASLGQSWDSIMEAHAAHQQMTKGSPVMKRLRGTPGRSLFHNAADNVIQFNEFSSVGAPTMLQVNGTLYYEVKLLNTDPSPQFGFASLDFSADGGDANQGVGDDATSWAVDGQRQQRFHIQGSSWPCTWRIGDIIGLAVNIDAGKMAVSKNGDWSDVPNGIVFEDAAIKAGVFPALSGSACRLRYNLDGSTHGPFQHAPPPAHVWADPPVM